MFSFLHFRARGKTRDNVMEWAAELQKLALPILLPGITISKKPRAAALVFAVTHDAALDALSEVRIRNTLPVTMDQ